MSEPIRRLLHDAATESSAAASFDELWLRGRRRRRRRRTALIAASGWVIIVAGIAVSLFDPGDETGLKVLDQPVDTCPVTDPGVGFTPPAPHPERPPTDGRVWHGSPELWTELRTEPGPDQKAVWWSVDFQGGRSEPSPDIEVLYQRLDSLDTDPVVFESPGTNAYTDGHGWFMMQGRHPDVPGCWQVTATYRDAKLTYVYLLEGD